MMRRVFSPMLCFGCLVTIGVTLSCAAVNQAKHDQTAAPEETKDVPVRNWGDWWPSTQFGADDWVSDDQIARTDNRIDSVNYGSIDTPWGFSWVSLWQLEDGVSLSLRFFSNMFDEEGRMQSPTGPAPGDIKMSVVCDGKVVRDARNANLIVNSWVGGMGSVQGSSSGEFDWLPPDFKDYWVRVDVKNVRHWFLIPYGLGADPAEHGNMLPVEAAGPARPAGASAEDQVHLWGSVSYELGRVEEMGWHVSMSVSNPFDTEISIFLYKDSARWELTYPRTSAVYNWPAGYSRFCSWTSISRTDAIDYYRTDSFTFWRTPIDTRNWGLLRVTVEDHAFDKVVPSSLFHYTHNWLEND
ncbi:MAG: hypothetical protein ICCCNLDF_00598 [Planctomycetes bacterium]|nr:hypothetical protein [Planctomycetota bacterium]